MKTRETVPEKEREMPFIKWRDSFNTGVEQFDQEHHKLVELIDTMYHAIRVNSGKEVVAQACADLIAYIGYHFTNEEQAMAVAAYPKLEAHKAEHASLRDKAKNFQLRIEGNDPEVAIQFYHFLRQWLENHIMVHDRAYGPALEN